MSDNRVEIRFKHRFSSKSDNGKAFRWLKDHLGLACDNAITNAIRFVYLPIALATSGSSRREVETEVKKAREFLDEKMMAALGSCCERESYNDDCINRTAFNNTDISSHQQTIQIKAVRFKTSHLSSDGALTTNGSLEIKFEHRFSKKSDNGQAFGWLKDNLGSACDDAITNVVRFVYLPIALAMSGSSRREVETEVKKAREFLEEKMMAVLGSCCKPEQNCSASNTSAPVFSRSVNRSDVAGQGQEETNSSNGAINSKIAGMAPGAATSKKPKIELIDDFLELDEDKLMEGY